MDLWSCEIVCLRVLEQPGAILPSKPAPASCFDPPTAFAGEPAPAFELKAIRDWAGFALHHLLLSGCKSRFVSLRSAREAFY